MTEVKHSSRLSFTILQFATTQYITTVIQSVFGRADCLWVQHFSIASSPYPKVWNDIKCSENKLVRNGEHNIYIVPCWRYLLRK
jgi:hypothetical protein